MRERAGRWLPAKGVKSAAQPQQTAEQLSVAKIPAKPSTRHGPRRRLLLTHLKSIERGVVLIDGNNVRGPGFALLSRRCATVAEWAAAERLPSISCSTTASSARGRWENSPAARLATCRPPTTFASRRSAAAARARRRCRHPVEPTRRLRLRRRARRHRSGELLRLLQRALLVGDEAGAPRGEGTAERRPRARAAGTSTSARRRRVMTTPRPATRAGWRRRRRAR